MRRLALMAEALAALTMSSVLIGIFSFRRVAAIAAKARRDAPASPSATARDISRAVSALARRVPWRAVCFQQGLAAQFMLRRRGLAAALHYGARHDGDGKLVAHVWVRSGDIDVIGCEGAEAYGLLAVFPPAA